MSWHPKDDGGNRPSEGDFGGVLIAFVLFSIVIGWLVYTCIPV